MMLLTMDAKGVRNMNSILVVVNKHNNARFASCWFIIYYRFVMHGNSNIKCIKTSSENHAAYEIMWKNDVQPDRPQVTIQHGACHLHAG